jgi:hypothetical protein
VPRTNEAVRQVNPVRSSICKRLKETRKELFGVHGGPALAARLGVSAWAWAGYEVGGQLPDEVAKAFLAVTGISAMWLLTGDGPMFRRDVLSGDDSGHATYARPISLSVFGADDASDPVKKESRALRTEIARLRAKISDAIHRAEARKAQTRETVEAVRALASTSRPKPLQRQANCIVRAAGPQVAQSHRELAEEHVRVTRIDSGKPLQIPFSGTKASRRRRRRQAVVKR